MDLHEMQQLQLGQSMSTVEELVHSIQQDRLKRTDEETNQYERFQALQTRIQDLEGRLRAEQQELKQARAERMYRSQEALVIEKKAMMAAVNALKRVKALEASLDTAQSRNGLLETELRKHAEALLQLRQFIKARTDEDTVTKLRLAKEVERLRAENAQLHDRVDELEAALGSEADRSHLKRLNTKLKSRTEKLKKQNMLLETVVQYKRDARK